MDLWLVFPLHEREHTSLLGECKLSEAGKGRGA